MKPDEDVKAGLQEMIDDNDAFYQWIIETFTIRDIIDLPDIWNAVSEEFNNDWIEHCKMIASL